MNMSQLKNEVGNPANQGGATTTIPSLKRTLSGGNSNSNSPHVTSHPVAGHGPGPMSIPSVMHASAATQPPQMLRAVTSSGVFNRQPVGSSSGGGGYGSRMSPNVSGPPSTSSAPSSSRSISQSSQDWRMYLTIEERQAVRSRIRDAYTNRCTTYEDLLQTVAAIEEELLHISAPSRLDYFKSGFEFENRVKLKKEQLQGQLGNASNVASMGGGGGVGGPSGSSVNDSSKRRLSSSPTSMNSVSSHSHNHHLGAPGSNQGNKPVETSPYKKQRN